MCLPVLLCVLAGSFQLAQGELGVLPKFVDTTQVKERTRVSEDTSVGTVIAVVKAVDPDNGPITYSLEGQAYDFFEINDKGEISVKAKLDFERNPTLTLIIVAEDQEGEVKKFFTSLTIDDANDLPPTFKDTYYNYNLMENTTVGHTVTVLNVTDQDSSNSLLQVSCDDSTPSLKEACDVFGVNRDQFGNALWTGFLVLKKPLDYEDQTSYSVRLIAFDGLNSRTQEIQIGVIDINDSPPRFVRAQGKVIPEGQPVGTYIDYVVAVDTDGEKNRRPIRYELYGDPEAVNHFSLGSVSGNITNKVVLDYEDKNREPGSEYTLEIRAREVITAKPLVLGNDATTTAVAVVKIRVTDINDNCPVFDKPIYNVIIPEDIQQGSNIPLQMTVTDADSGERSKFSMELRSRTDMFQIIPSEARSPASVTVMVIDASKIDYERPPNKFELVVTVRENGKNIEPQRCTSSAEIHITVEDVNDENPEFDKDSYRTSVREDAEQGFKLITVTATDLDSGKFGQAGLRYRLIGSGEHLFDIDPISGVVTVAQCDTPGTTPCIDYERKQRYDLAVQANDNDGAVGSLPGTTQLVIDVVNVNDNQPLFTTKYVRSILEGEIRTTDELIVTAIDLDKDKVTYSIPSGQTEAKLWQINPVSGEITAIQKIKFSDLLDPVRGTFVFQAQASDGKFNSLADIEIRVIDINDNTPIFLPTRYEISIPETTLGGVSVIQISVSDLDSPTSGNGQVDVTIDEGNFGKFATRKSGNISNVILTNIYTAVDARFDYDIQKRFNLTVKARDRGSPPKTGTATVIVHILNENNKNPYFDPPTSSTTVEENKPVNHLVTTVTAQDKDADSQLEISFAPGTRAFNPSGVEVTDENLYKDLFSIDKAGNVRIKSPLDRDIVSFMIFNLFVQDVKVTPPQEGTGLLFIRILEYNDQAPYFELPFYNLSVKEERPISSFVGSLLARDEDDQIRAYQLLSNPGNLFSITINSGVLRVNGRIDYEQQHNVTLIAQAFDTGSPSLQNTTTVFINIINLNDNTPVFNQTVYQIKLEEHSNRTDALLTVKATDKDEGDYGVVRYTADDKFFRVDGITGAIYLKPGADLDREALSTYTFQVTAYDSPLDPLVRLNTTAPVYITLVDKNDHCPVFQGQDYSSVVIETADVEDQVLEMFASDLDFGINRHIKFTIDKASARPPIAYELFDIRSVQSPSGNLEFGRIIVKKSLIKKPGEYNFTVIASDMNGINTTGEMCSTSTLVRIRVQEAINDAPRWKRPPRSNYSIDVLESQYRGMLVYDCRAVDPNSGPAGIIDYSFNVKRNFTQFTPEFRINSVTCVIRAQIVFDREQVSSYVLTVVAKDRGIPSASSETTLIIHVLDVNDNDPEFPMRNGETIPYNFEIKENDKTGKIIGTVSATDKDIDHKNNKVFYKIVAGNDDNYFVLDRETGDLRLNLQVAVNGLDREAKGVYSMDILAYNDVNDDSVIRYRRKRSTNPSIVTVNVKVEDTNDTPPKFTDTNYHGCVSLNARFGQSILKVEAVDADLNPNRNGTPILYSILSEGTQAGGFFMVEPQYGIIRNAKLLQNIDTRQPILQVQADDHTETAVREVGSVAVASVRIFVTDTSNEVVLEVSQPLADVRFYQDQLIRVLENSSTEANPISFVCVQDIRDHINDDGTVTFESSDVVVAAVGQNADGQYYVYPGTLLHRILTEQLQDEKTAYKFRTLYVKTVKIEEGDEEFVLTEDPVLAVFIIALLLFFLAIILFCLACFLIRNSKKKKMKKLRAVQHTHVEVVRQEPPPPVVTSVNPVYDNKAFVGEEEYAIVQKKQPTPVSPPIIPVMVPAEDEEPQDVYIPEPIDEDRPQQPVPVIVTEPIMGEDPTEETEPDFEPETIIETEVMPDNEIEGEAGEPADVIDVEIRDTPPVSQPDSPAGSPPGSPTSDHSPPPPPEDIRIEDEIM